MDPAGACQLWARSLSWTFRSSWRQSVALIGVGIPVVERLCGRDALEVAVGMRKAADIQQLTHRLVVRSRHGFDLGVSAEGADFAPNVDHSFVQRVAQTIPGIVANQHSAGLRHERRETADAA